MTIVYYNPAYAAAGYSFPTTRKARWIANSLKANPIYGITLKRPAPITEKMLRTVHDSEYIRAVRTGEPRGLAQSQGFYWDAGLWSMVLASNGGVVSAALLALQEGVAGSLSSGLHHARRDSGCGFCTFNGLALAAAAVQDAGAGDVLILDFDAHCGGGTHELIADNPHIWQVDVSVSPCDWYEPSERTTLDVVKDSCDYLPTIVDRLCGLRGLHFGLCLYNAGMDPHEDDSCGGLMGITDQVIRDREGIVFDWCREQGVPIAFVLAGGYTGRKMDEAKLVGLHRLTLSAAVKGANNDSD
jgi:acetoin utilization deacetylase AcuC-like enzyme